MNDIFVGGLSFGTDIKVCTLLRSDAKLPLPAPRRSVKGHMGDMGPHPAGMTPHSGSHAHCKHYCKHASQCHHLAWMRLTDLYSTSRSFYLFAEAGRLGGWICALIVFKRQRTLKLVCSIRVPYRNKVPLGNNKKNFSTLT